MVSLVNPTISTATTGAITTSLNLITTSATMIGNVIDSSNKMVNILHSKATIMEAQATMNMEEKLEDAKIIEQMTMASAFATKTKAISNIVSQDEDLLTTYNEAMARYTKSQPKT